MTTDKPEQLPNLVDIPQTQPDTPRVDRMLGAFDKQWESTAVACIKRAEELEMAAAELRQRATDLNSARNWLHDVKQTVLFEIESRDKCVSLMFVNPSKDD